MKEINEIFNKYGKIKIGTDCIFYLKCEISCQEKTVSGPISWFIFKPFLS